MYFGEYNFFLFRDRRCDKTAEGNKKKERMRNNFLNEIVREMALSPGAYIHFVHTMYFVLEEMFIKASQFSHLTDEICSWCQSLSYMSLLLFCCCNSYSVYLCAHTVYQYKFICVCAYSIHTGYLYYADDSSVKLAAEGISFIFQRNAGQEDLFLKPTILEWECTHFHSHAGEEKTGKLCKQ